MLPFLFGCEKKEEAPPKEKPTVTVMNVIPRDVPVSFQYIATTESSRMVEIKARVNGFLEKRMYVEGEMVKENQILFEMDKKPFIAQVDAAKAALKRREASMLTAKLNMDRAIPLEQLNALSTKDMDDAIGAYESAAAAVEQAQAELISAELNLSYCTIRSPLDGISSDAQQQDGTYLNVESSELTSVSQLDPIWVNFSLSENQLQNYRNQITKGQLIAPKGEEYEIEVYLVDGSKFPFKGKITFLQPYYNAKTGTFLIRSSFKNPKGILRPNQYLSVQVNGAKRPSAILVPQKAVQQSAKGHYVWVIDKEDKATFRPVVVGEWKGSDWFINEGLKQGDKVVVDGGMTLQAGESVMIKGS